MQHTFVNKQNGDVLETIVDTDCFFIERWNKKANETEYAICDGQVGQLILSAFADDVDWTRIE